MQVNPYLHYNGNCEEALKYYQKVLGAKIEAMFPYESGPPDMPTPPDYKKKIMHAKVTIDGEVLMAADTPRPVTSRRRRAFPSRYRWKIPLMPNAGSRRSPKAALSTCLSARPSSPKVLACAPTSSACPGW